MALTRQKIINELQLQRAKIYPEYIIQLLNQLYNRIKINSPDSPAILLKISDILSYLLYSGNDKQIQVREELDIVTEMIYLERNDEQSSEIELYINGNIEEEVMMQPMIVFTIFYHCFNIIKNQKENELKLLANIYLEDNNLKLAITCNSVSECLNDKIVNWCYKIAHELEKIATIDRGFFTIKLNQDNVNSELLVNIETTKKQIDFVG